MTNTLPKQLKNVQKALNATNEQMAYKLRMNLDTYIAIREGGRLLPVPARMYYQKRLQKMLYKLEMEVEGVPKLV